MQDHSGTKNKTWNFYLNTQQAVFSVQVDVICELKTKIMAQKRQSTIHSFSIEHEIVL